MDSQTPPNLPIQNKIDSVDYNISRKIHLIKIIAILVFILFPFLSFYLGMQYQLKLSTLINPISNSSGSTISTQIDDLSNWQTYTHPDQHFSFKYPAGYSICENANYLGISPQLLAEPNVQCYLGDGSPNVLLITFNNNSQTLKSLYADGNYAISQIVLKDKQMTRFDRKFPPNDEVNFDASTIFYTLPKLELIYQFSTGIDEDNILKIISSTEIIDTDIIK